MAKGQRSPFGDLVFRHRHRLNMTQLHLARAASKPSRAGDDAATVSERTVAAIERLRAEPSEWHNPRTSTAVALIDVFGLEPGTPDFAEFMAAARALRDRRQPGASQVEPVPPARRPGQPKTAKTQDFIAAGREPHIARLQGAIDDAVAGVPGVVFVSASPGTGKTALIEHACRQAIGRHDNIVVLWGERAGHLGGADPHQPFRQILGTLAGDTLAAGPHQLVSPDNARRIGARTATGITALLDEGEGLIDRFISAGVLRRLAGSDALDAVTASNPAKVLDLPTGALASALGHHEQFFRVLARYSASGPTILVLEDLHWADVGTTSFLFHLVRRLHDQQIPLLILGSFRPAGFEPIGAGDRHPFPTVLRESARFFDELVLDLSTAVGGDAGRAFVDAMVAHSISLAPDGFRQTLFEQTAGLPLFVLGMIRWCRTAGIIGDDGQSGASLHWTPDPANLPAEIDMVFAEQVSRLPPDVRSLVNAASVQGGSFSAEVVMQVLGLARPTTIEVIDDQLARRFQIVAPSGVVTIAGQRSHTYQFAHSLLSEYAYNQLTEFEQAHYHAATAEAMRELYGDGEHDGARSIAFHFDQAGDRTTAAAAYMKAGLMRWRIGVSMRLATISRESASLTSVKKTRLSSPRRSSVWGTARINRATASAPPSYSSGHTTWLCVKICHCWWPIP